MSNWNIGLTVTYPAETAAALEDHVALDLAAFLNEKGVPADRMAVLAALAEHEVNPLIVSQCLERTLSIMQDVEAQTLKTLERQGQAV